MREVKILWLLGFNLKSGQS